MKRFVLFAVPCLFWWFFVLYMIFGNFQFHAEGMKFLESCSGVNAETSSNTTINCGDVSLNIVLFIFFWPYYVLVFAVYDIFLFFSIPIHALKNGFYFDNWLIWFAIIVFVLTIVGGLNFKFGHFLEDSTEVTGYHYEAEYKASDDKIEIKKVEETRGGNEYISNFFLLLLRMIIIAAVGLIIYIVYKVKHNKKAQNSL